MSISFFCELLDENAVNRKKKSPFWEWRLFSERNKKPPIVHEKIFLMSCLLFEVFTDDTPLQHILQALDLDAYLKINYVCKRLRRLQREDRLRFLRKVSYPCNCFLDGQLNFLNIFYLLRIALLGIGERGRRFSTGFSYFHQDMYEPTIWDLVPEYFHLTSLHQHVRNGLIEYGKFTPMHTFFTAVFRLIGYELSFPLFWMSDGRLCSLICEDSFIPNPIRYLTKSVFNFVFTFYNVDLGLAELNIFVDEGNDKIGKRLMYIVNSPNKKQK